MSTPADLPPVIARHLGQELGVSPWLTIDQAMIDAHAATTGEAHWIHNDPARAAAEGPFGGTIAQGSLVLSSLYRLRTQLPPLGEAILFELNYGFDRVRFVAPTPAGARIRARFVLEDARPKGPGRLVVTTAVTVELEGSETPALVARWLGLVQLAG